MAPTDIDEILKQISGLPLKDALTYLAVNKITKYTSDGYGRIKKAIQDKYNERKYAFVPDKEEAKLIKQFLDNPQYKQVQLLIPHYRYIDIIRSGLLIAHYHQHNNPQNNTRVKRIKEQILGRPNGSKLLKIANLSTTPYFKAVLEYTYHLKSQNYAETALEEKFDELVSAWEESSKLVQNEHTVHDVVSFCKSQIASKKSLFWILGMKHAGKTVESAVDTLMKDNYLTKQGYTYKLTKQPEGIKPRVEVMFIRNNEC